MSRELHADTHELRMTADVLDMHAADLQGEHSAAHEKMSSAVSGFGDTSSAAALNERIAQWEQETAEHHAELVEHSDGHRAAGTHYTNTDSQNSTAIQAVGSSVEASKDL